MRDRGRVFFRFVRNRTAMIGLVVFLLIFLAVSILPFFMPIDLSYSESTQANVPPGLSLLTIPREVRDNVKELSVGPTFSVGVTKDGKVFTFGHTKVAGAEDVANIPSEVSASTIVSVAAGYDHVVALSDDGRIFVFGNRRLFQGNVPRELDEAGRIVQIAAGNQCSAAVTENGEVFLWGNGNLCDIRVRKEYQGRIRKVAFTGFAYVALLTDGTVRYTGHKETAVAAVPEEVMRGPVLDIAGTAQTAAAVMNDGRVIVWGNAGHGENVIPEELQNGAERAVQISGGRYHYTVVTQKGRLFAFGSDTLSQTRIPASFAKERFMSVDSGGYQNFAMTTGGELRAFGLKGYVCGTDELGRDVLSRLLNGGRRTMTVGAIAVIISTAIGIVVGGISGYFGGKWDLLLQRFSEIVASLPFLPFAMILSSIIGARISEDKRIVLIMVVLGVLSWTGLQRLVRAKVLREREKEFVIAARAIGVRQTGIVFRHIVPNVLSIILVSATLDFATCMLTESSLSYLSFGVLPPEPTWGNMLSGANNSTVIQNAWWRWVFPAAVFGICTICINLIGDGLRDAVDERSEG